MTRQLSKKKVFILICGVVLIVAGTVWLVVHTYKQPSFDPFASATPRTPCGVAPAHDMVALEKDGVSPPKNDNPDYCQRPVRTGEHKGSIIARYDNMELLRTSTTTLDIATDDGAPLDTISVWGVEKVSVEPVNDIYSPDSTARLTLKSDGGYRKGQAVQDGISTRYVQSHPLTINIQTWCGKHSYKTTITEKMRLSDTP